jgi:quinol-cytochrome oxidoreductase complex cytochrome b subunit
MVIFFGVLIVTFLIYVFSDKEVDNSNKYRGMYLALSISSIISLFLLGFAYATVKSDWVNNVANKGKEKTIDLGGRAIEELLTYR